MEQNSQRSEGAVDVGGEPRRGEPPTSAAPSTPRRRAHRYGAGQKLSLIRAYEASEKDMRVFCEEHGLSTASLCKWRRQLAQHGEEGLMAASNPRNAKGRTRRSFTAEERLAAVLALAKSGVTQQVFAKRWGVSVSALSRWRQAYELGGGKALQAGGIWSPQGGEPPAPVSVEAAAEIQGGELSAPALRGPGRRVPPSTEAAIVQLKQEQPRAGLKRIRDVLWRFLGLRVSTGAVRRVLSDHDLHDPDPPKARRRRPLPRRFERARPGQLWQTDITSYVLARPGRRVYLTLFLDDHSRYIVGWRLLAHQRQELVLEALEDGILRYGKPQEILTDQGPQYHSWRGRSAFRKRLDQLGIRQVLARTHHPQTVGKCERLWKTIGEELWERVRPDDLGEAQRRLGHWIAHYNFFRPHQGIDGLVPADRFFGAEDALRQTLSKELSEDELGLALNDPIRQPVYLFGRIGGQSVSLHGEGGQLVLESDGEPVGSVPLMQMGMATPTVTEQSQNEREVSDDDGQEPGQRAGAVGGSSSGSGREHGSGAAVLREDSSQSAPPLPQADQVYVDSADAGAGAGPVGIGNGRATSSGTQDVHGAAGVLAGQDLKSGGGGATRSQSPASVAAFAAGDSGYAGGLAEAAAMEAVDVKSRSAAGPGSGETEEAHREAGAGAVPGGRRDRSAAGAAGQQRAAAAVGRRGDEDRTWSRSDQGTSQDEPRELPTVREKKVGQRPERRGGRRWLGRWVSGWLKRGGSDTASDGGSQGGSQ